MMHMRVLMIHNRWGGDGRGGAERVVERLSTALGARGHTVHVVAPTLDLRAPNIVPFTSLGRSPAPLRVLWHAIDLMNLPAAVSLARILAHVRPDVVHTHNLVGCGGLTPRVIRRRKIPYVHTLHDVQLLTPSGLLIRGQPASAVERSVLGAWYRALRHRGFGSPTLVTSPSQWLLDAHRAAGFFPSSATAVIGNPIDLPTAPPARTSGPVRRFLYVGQVEGAKGVNVLLEAYRQLRARFPDVSLQVVGNGTLAPLLRRASREFRDLILRGRLDAVGVQRAIAAADVVVVPSLAAENQPSVILEAYAFGVPVIASRVGGIPELVHEGETGFLADPGSVEDLLRCLRAATEESPHVRAMAPACAAVAAEHATERIVTAFEDAYTHAAESVRTRA